MARKKQTPVTLEDARTVGALLRGLRRAAGLRAVQDAADAPGCPAARQTIYPCERGGLTHSLKRFLDLVEFYALEAHAGPTAKPVDDLRAQAVAAVARALTVPAYHVTTAWDLVRRLQPQPSQKR